MGDKIASKFARQCSNNESGLQASSGFVSFSLNVSSLYGARYTCVDFLKTKNESMQSIEADMNEQNVTANNLILEIFQHFKCGTHYTHTHNTFSINLLFALCD